MDALSTAFYWLDYGGVAVFAATGALAAARKKHDIITFGFFAAITGVGGGTLRDLLIDAPVFWVVRPGYIIVCLITAPLIEPARLIEGWDKLQQPGKRFAFSVTHFPYPIQRALKQTSDGGLDMFWPEHMNSRSQDLEPAFHDAAQFYWGWAEAWTGGEIAFSPISAPVILPRSHVVDIDTPEDWEMAELTYKVLRRI